MGRIRDLGQYLGALTRGDIWFMLDGNTFAKGQKMSGQQVYDLCKGADGRQLEIRNNGTQLQWRYSGDASWTNLVALSTLRGEDGKELEVRVSGGYIQTRLTGGSWANLVAIEDLKGNQGDPAENPNLQFAITALASNATPTASVTGTYPNLTVTLGIPKGVDAALPVLGFTVTALAWDATPTASVTGTYPNLTVALGLPSGRDADQPSFTFSAEGTASGSTPDVEMTGTYPNLNLKFKIPAGLQGVEGRGPVVLANGNYGNWDAGLSQFVDSGVPAVAAVSEAAVTFTQAEVRANIASGELLKVLMGKIRKWFADMGSLAFKNKADWNTDIDNPPTIPTKTSDLTNDSDFVTSSALPTVNNGKLTIRKNSSDPGTEFSANQSGDVTANLGLGTMADENKADYETVSRKDTSIPQTPVSGNYPTTQAIKTYIDGLIGGVSTQLFFYSFDYGQFATGTPSIPSGVVLVAGDELYNFADGTCWQWNGSSWIDITGSITKTPVDGSTAIIRKRFVDGEYGGYPGTTVYEINGGTGAWYAYPETVHEPDNITLELNGSGLLGVKPGSITSTQIALAVMALINGAAQKTDGYEAIKNFVGSETAGSLSGMVITKQLVHVSASSNQALTVTSVSVDNEAFVIVLTATAAITVQIPSSGDYISMAEATYTLASGDVIEIHVFHSSTSGKYHIGVVTQ